MSTEKSGFPESAANMPPPYPAGQSQQTPGYGQPYPAQPQQPGGYGQPYPAQPQQPGGYGQPYQGQPQQGGYIQTNVVTTQPYIQTAAVVTGPRPSNYLVPAVLACIFCCWPIGICAIVSANNANSAADRGDMVEANDKAKTARNLTIAAVVFGVVWITITIVVRVVLTANSTTYYN